MIEEIAEKPEDYTVFWTNYGAVLKEGLHYDPDSRDHCENREAANRADYNKAATRTGALDGATAR